MPIAKAATENDIDKILYDIEKCRRLRCPVKDYLRKLINLGFDFSGLSLNRLIITGTNFSEAKGLTIDNWLSAPWASYTKLPPYFDFTHYDNLHRVGNPYSGITQANTPYNGITHTDFSIVKGLNPHKPKAWDWNKGLPKKLNFPEGWFAERELYLWDFSNTEDVTAQELSRAKRLRDCTLPRCIDLRELIQRNTDICNCHTIDPILPEGDDRALNSIFYSIKDIRFSSFRSFLNAGSLDMLHALRKRGTRVKRKGVWPLVDDYIGKFFQLDLAKGLYSEEEANKVKVLALETI